ncbi:hypothetical protein AVMA1855_25360 [Acidovorax sp. SUPP1855]|uniref:hypothetical protein n=1 Tax=Acidovorax sp. SUPP1855 TaxID=431774 RepID=UPI0023DE683C|nr:hypothetical protein [Acidovorax sp. SUPP1855]GKS87546.1 hypothetical protein AVMA1855_25360 [Acidovorax sp. SUPP1855]
MQKTQKPSLGAEKMQAPCEREPISKPCGLVARALKSGFDQTERRVNLEGFFNGVSMRKGNLCV